MTEQLRALIEESVRLHRETVRISAAYRLVPPDLCISMRRVADSLERALNETPALTGEQ